MIDPSKPDAADEAFTTMSLIAMAHANLFRLLAYAFYDPTQELVQELVSGSFISELRGYEGDLVSHHHTGVEALGPLENYQAGLSVCDQDALLKDLKVEYARLFIGPGSPVVQPYETFYDEKLTSESRPLLMVSPAAIEVERIYREAGLAMSTELREPPDHFAVELEFVYYLSRMESDALVAGDKTAAKKWRRSRLAFVDGHLGCWGPRFCSKVQKESTHPFYRSLAHLAGIFVEMEVSNTAISCHPVS